MEYINLLTFTLSGFEFYNWLLIKTAAARKEIPGYIVSALKPIRYYNQLDSLDSKAKNTHFHVSLYRVSLLRDLRLLGLNSEFSLGSVH